MSSPTLHTPIPLNRKAPTPMAPPPASIVSNVTQVVALPILGWLDDGAFTPIDLVTLESFVDIPVRSWEHDFTDMERQRYINLKRLMPSGRVAPGLVPIVRELNTECGGGRD